MRACCQDREKARSNGAQPPAALVVAAAALDRLLKGAVASLIIIFACFLRHYRVATADRASAAGGACCRAGDGFRVPSCRMDSIPQDREGCGEQGGPRVQA